MAEWVEVKVDRFDATWPDPDTLPPDGSTVEYLRRRGGLSARMRGRVRHVEFNRAGSHVPGAPPAIRSAEIVRSDGWLLGECERFADEPSGDGDYWRLVE